MAQMSKSWFDGRINAVRSGARTSNFDLCYLIWQGYQTHPRTGKPVYSLSYNDSDSFCQAVIGNNSRSGRMYKKLYEIFYLEWNVSKSDWLVDISKMHHMARDKYIGTVVTSKTVHHWLVVANDTSTAEVFHAKLNAAAGEPEIKQPIKLEFIFGSTPDGVTKRRWVEKFLNKIQDSEDCTRSDALYLALRYQ